MATIISEADILKYLGALGNPQASAHSYEFYAGSGRPSIQAYYGIYDSKLTAFKMLHMAYDGSIANPANITETTKAKGIPQGFKVAVLDINRSVVEFQFKKPIPQDGYSMNDLETEYYSKSEIAESLNNKVSCVSGKGLIDSRFASELEYIQTGYFLDNDLAANSLRSGGSISADGSILVGENISFGGDLYIYKTNDELILDTPNVTLSVDSGRDHIYTNADLCSSGDVIAQYSLGDISLIETAQKVTPLTWYEQGSSLEIDSNVTIDHDVTVEGDLRVFGDVVAQAEDSETEISLVEVNNSKTTLAEVKKYLKQMYYCQFTNFVHNYMTHNGDIAINEEMEIALNLQNDYMMAADDIESMNEVLNSITGVEFTISGTDSIRSNALSFAAQMANKFIN